MYYFRIPSFITICELSHADRSVFEILCLYCFRFAHGNGDKEFWITDRELALKSKSSRETVYFSKRKLKKERLIDFRIGPGNKTHYRLISLIDAKDKAHN